MSSSYSPGWASIVRKTITFTGATGLGEVGAVPIFTITGQVCVVSITGICTVNLGEAAPGSATLALGVTNSTSLFIAATAALDIDAGEIWVSSAPEANGIAMPSGLKDILIARNIIATVAVANINAGAITFVVRYLPESANGKLA